MKNNLNDNVSNDYETQKIKVVQVKAQVMRWDASTGLWGQCAGGGQSFVFLFKELITVNKHNAQVMQKDADFSLPPSCISSLAKSDPKIRQRWSLTSATTPCLHASLFFTTSHTPIIHTTPSSHTTFIHTTSSSQSSLSHNSSIHPTLSSNTPLIHTTSLSNTSTTLPISSLHTPTTQPTSSSHTSSTQPISSSQTSTTYPTSPSHTPTTQPTSPSHNPTTQAPPPTSTLFHYSILALRCSDESPLINLALSSEMEYSRASRSMLHHWSIGGRRYGLTFQSSHEASHFQAAVLSALDYLRGKKQEEPIQLEACRLPSSPSLPLSNIDTPKRRLSSVKSSSSSSNLHSTSISKDHPSIPLPKSPLLMPPPLPLQSSIFLPPPSSSPTPPTSSHLQHHPLTLLNLDCEQLVLPRPRLLHGSQSVSMTYRKPRALTPPLSPEKSVILLSSLNHQPSSSIGPSIQPVTLDNFEYSNKNITCTDAFRKAGDDDDDEDVFENSRRNSSATESYVHLTKNAPPLTTIVPPSKHDYSYPTLYQTNTTSSFGRSHSNPRMSLPISTSSSRRLLSSHHPSSLNLNTIYPPNILPRKARKQSKSKHSWYREPTLSSTLMRVRCSYCQELFLLGDRQVCKDAPDKHLERIKTITCYSCLQGALYHFGPSEDEEKGCRVTCRRGCIASLVCLVCPCLCLFPLLHSCHTITASLTAPTHQRDITL